MAAISAKGAKRQSQEAKAAAIRLGQVLQLSDLLQDIQELQTLLARKNFNAIAAKASHLRGRIVRFRKQSYNLLGEDVSADLESARLQIEIVGRVAGDTRTPDTRHAKIQLAFGMANEALNRAFAIQYGNAYGE